MRHYECVPNVWHEQPLVFDWDAETGEVSGPSAAAILEVASWGVVSAHPYPCEWALSPEPTKSLADMAVIVGHRHVLPDDLARHYPVIADESEEEGVVY